jgi:hypothetical protein
VNIFLPFDPKRFPTHITSNELIEIIGKDGFESNFSFAFVRNPWDRQVSLYSFMMRKPNHHQHKLVKRLDTFDKYIEWRCAEEVRFQSDFICSSGGDILVDFVGRFEQIDDDFSDICARIGIFATLPKLNVSNTIPYQQFNNHATRELIRKTYAPDIELFGYNFE